MAAVSLAAPGALVEGDFQYGIIVLAPLETVTSMLRDTDAIALWARPVVHCCLVENGLAPSALGCTRRTVLTPGASQPTESILRETLVSARLTAGCVKGFVTTRLTEACHRAAGQPVCQVTTLPCVDMVTTITVSPVAGCVDKDRCFVDWYSTVSCASLQDLAAVLTFLRERWAQPLVDALADAALHLVLPPTTVRGGGVSPTYQRLFDEYDDLLVRVGAAADRGTAVTLELSRSFERLFDGWLVAVKELSSMERLVAGLRDELQSRLAIHAEMASRVAQLVTENNRLHAAVIFAEHGIARPSGGQDSVPVAAPVVTDEAPLAPGSRDASESAAAAAMGHDASSESATVASGHDSAAIVAAPGGGSEPRPPMTHHQRMVGKASFSEAECLAQFARLDADRTGMLSADAISDLLSAADPRSDYDIALVLAASRSKAAAAGRDRGAHISTTPRPADARRAYFRAAADAWIARYGGGDRRGVTPAEFAVLLCQLAK